MHRLSILVIATFASGACLAQNPVDLVGRWTFEVAQDEPDPRCGELRKVGEMNVTKKITTRAYRGNTHTRHLSEKCGVRGTASSDFTLRIRDNKVEIEYDAEEGWPTDSLLLEGVEMAGLDDDGNELRFVKQAVEPELEPASDIDLAKFDEFLSTLEPEYTSALRREFGANMLKNLRKTGLDRDESTEIAMQTLERMAECVLDVLREDILAKGVPLEDIIEGRRSYKLLEPDKIDYRDYGCIYEAAQNAGVIIR